MIESERERQDQKWGKRNEHDGDADLVLNAVLTEEVGEVAQAVLRVDVDNLREELVQVAAVAVRWLEILPRD